MSNVFTDELFNLIGDYGDNKIKFDSLKKVIDQENKSIKKLMRDLDIEQCNNDTYTCKYIVQKRESINEELLIELLVKNWAIDCDRLGIIKMKPSIDFDALESALYKGEVSKEMISDINKSRIIKQVETIRISKNKGE